MARRAQPGVRIAQAAGLTSLSKPVRKLSTAVSLACPAELKIAASQQQITVAQRAQPGVPIAQTAGLTSLSDQACNSHRVVV